MDTSPHTASTDTYPLDPIDKGILSHLLNDARTPFLEIGRRLKVSGGTIHQRIDKLKEAGVISGSSLHINYERIGLDVTALLGVHVESARQVGDVIEALRALPEVVEAYFTTGAFALIIKVYVQNMRAYHTFLVDHLQQVEGIRFTESFLCLDQPISRPIQLS